MSPVLIENDACMAVLQVEPCASSLAEYRIEGVTAARRAVLSVLHASGATPLSHDARLDQRVPFARLIRLTPMHPTSGQSVDPPRTVVSKNLSLTGLGFFHPEPWPHRRFLVELELPGERVFSFLAQLAWSRFARQGWYESGAHFLALLAPNRDD